jgi:glycosyltransferase involved in cell wall biosynthesis
MRVLLDISPLGLGQMYALSRCGIYRVHEHLAEGLAASGECELVLCANHSSVAHQGVIEYLRTRPGLAGVPLLGAPRTGAATAIRRGMTGAHQWLRAVRGTNVLPGLLRRGARLVDRRVHRRVSDASPPVDVFHSPGEPLPPPRQGRRAPRRFLTIYDLAYTRFPHLYGAAFTAGARAVLGSVRPGDSILTSSHSTREQLCELGMVPPERVSVTHLAADPRIFSPCADAERVQAVRARYGVPDGPYLLSVNTLDPRKNMPRAIRAFGRMVRQEGMRELSFVLVGHDDRGSGEVARAIAEHPALRGRVVLTGHVDDGELAPLYSGATAFVYPSLYEGFGLAPLEAMQCGTPVITSSTSSLPEVVGRAGIMVDPEDDDALCAAMLAVCRDDALRQRMRRDGLVQAARFSWERCTRQTLDAYRNADG